jgi:hypothetical protein
MFPELKGIKLILLKKRHEASSRQPKQFRNLAFAKLYSLEQLTDSDSFI